ncbi:MAG: HAD-IB family hydrolase [Caulobacteraceae bacterium]
MGSSAPPRQRDATDRPLVAFDFDGTLTVRDSFRAFLAWRAGPAGYGARLARIAPDAAGYILHRDRGRLKAAMVRAFLAGVPRDRMAAEAGDFAKTSAAGLFRRDALLRWTEWRERGALVVIVSASPDILLAPFADALGAERLIATRLEFDARDRATGRLDGANCRGAEKVARLREAFGPHVRLAAAYGDSSGDTEMLALADDPGMKVFTEAP